MAETALEWIEGGGLSFTVPAAMLDPSVPMSSVLSARTWQEQLSADERASLRRFLPDPTASEEDVRALLAGLFGDGDGDGDGDARGDTRVNMHFGNPAERVWREIQARERDPEVMAHRNAIGVVERGAHELEVRLHHARVARAGMGMLRKFRDADADAAGGDGGDGGGGVTREDRLRAWRRRDDATPEPDRSRRVGGSDDDDAANDNDETKNTRDEVAASEEAARRAMRVAMEAADAASKLAATSGGPGAMTALRAAETAMAAAEAAAAEARRARTRWIEGGSGGGARSSIGKGPATGGNRASAEKKPKVANPHSMRVDGPIGLNRKFSTNEDW